MRRQYPFHLIEPKWQCQWDERQTFRAWNPGEAIPREHPFAQRHGLAGAVTPAQLPCKYYILDMFPYPSGAGLHVGHPEGYTATDILARYRRARGFNVLHPMGWDAFGLPAEQYAIKTGQHPRATTEANIANFTKQIKSLGFSYDWTREVDTTDPKYFRWTQWIFLKLYNSWFNPETNRAEPIETLKYPAELGRDALPRVQADQQVGPTDLESRRRAYRDSKRLAYVAEAPMWWCEQLGTVLANEEVIDGKSEVGGFPVVRRPMRQWMLRITAYAEKLLADLDTIDWSDSLKEMQRNWIGKSEGAEVHFTLATDAGSTGYQPVPSGNLPDGTGEAQASSGAFAQSTRTDIPPGRLPSGTGGSPVPPKTDAPVITVFTTRPDTLFGATYMVLSPEHKLLAEIVTPEQREVVKQYQQFASGKSDLERTELVKEKTGVFTGAYAINPVNGEKIPIWIADYVLASYGTGAIMAVPAHDERDFEFAQKFNLPIRHVVAEPGLASIQIRELKPGELRRITSFVSNEEGTKDIASWTEGVPFTGEGIAFNSPLIDLLPTAEAKMKITAWLEAKGLGKKTVNYKLRDWLFSRQRYWGEPFPIVWKKDAHGNDYHEAVPEKSLPVLPPKLDDYKPTAEGQPPLARAREWVELKSAARRETNTMPQWAGSCWYYLRFLDAMNEDRFVSREAERYWMGGERPAGVFPLLSPGEWHAQLENLRRRAFVDGKRPPFAVEYAQVTPHLAREVQRVSGLDVSDYRHSVDVYAVRHVFNEHGNPFFEEPRGLLALTLEDLERLPEILAEPDSVEFAAKHQGGFKRFVISKRVNGFVCVVEEARSKHGQLQLLTMYKRKTTARDVTPKAPLSDTSETLRREPTKAAAPAPVKPTPGVDLYVGGTEHAVLHLLYARFWHKVLFDLGHVSTTEPFFKLVNQGLILGEDMQKMSKSRGNVVNPDDILVDYGADAFRLYEMFMGPLEMVKPWNTKGVEGVYRFLGRVWRLFVDEASEVEFEQALTTAEAQRRGELLNLIKLHMGIKDAEPAKAQLKALHTCIKKVTEDLDGLRFNTAISAMMIFVNEAITWETKSLSVLRDFLILLQPFAPHIAEELWSKVQCLKSNVPESGATTSDLRLETLDLAYQPWPKFDPALLVEDTREIPVQVNGKLRDVIRVAATATAAELEATAFASEKVQPFLAGKTIKKVIVVPGKLVNIAVAQ